MSFLRNTRKACARILFRLLADRLLTFNATKGDLHILAPRRDTKLRDLIVSSFKFAGSMLGGTVLKLAELAPMHALDFAVDQVEIRA